MKSRGKSRLPPYLTYATWQRLLGALYQHVPLQLDRSYLKDLGVSESTALTVRTTLSFLDLISPENEPTDKLLNLVKTEGENRRLLLREIAEAAYKPVFGGLDLEHATLGQVKECFRQFGADNNVGNKCLSFFLALAKDSGIGLSPNLLTRSRVGTSQKASPQALPPRKRRSPSLSSSPRRQLDRAGLLGSNYLAAKLPDFDPNWPKDVRGEWFDRLQTMMFLMDKFPSFNTEWTDALKAKWFDSMKEFLGKNSVQLLDS